MKTYTQPIQKKKTVSYTYKKIVKEKRKNSNEINWEIAQIILSNGDPPPPPPLKVTVAGGGQEDEEEAARGGGRGVSYLVL